MLLGLIDDSRDELLMYIVEDAISQIELYIHAPICEKLIPVAAKLAVNIYLMGGYNETVEDSEGHIIPIPTPTGVGEVKRESYENVSFEYVTSLDVAEAAAKNSSSSSSVEAGITDPGYFQEQIVPLLRGFRKVQTIWR